MQQKLGPLLLCGLMVGPVLGSGIIILPPLALDILGDSALFAWMVIMAGGTAFAWIFGRLSVLRPGNAGAALAVEDAFGHRAKTLASLYLIGAVFFGPAAVMLTAAHYLAPFIPLEPHLLAVAIIGACIFPLLQGVTDLGKLSLILSSLCAATLAAGGAAALFSAPPPVPEIPASPGDFGYALLLLFWTMVGWEVVTTYSGDVRDPARTIPRAVWAGALLVAGVSLLAAAGLQSVTGDGSPRTVTALLAPLFGPYAQAIMGILAASLCISTYLMIIGGVSRLAASMAREGTLPAFLGTLRPNNAPARAVITLILIQCVSLGLASRGVLNLESLVGIADGFFLANALCGIMAGFKLFKRTREKTVCLILAAGLSIVLLCSSWIVLGVIAGMGAWILLRPRPTLRTESE